MKKVLILGGGVSGLATAWFLNRLSPSLSITLLEKSPRLGGWIDTFEENGFLFEAGPRGFRPAGKGAITLKLVKELNLEKDLLYVPHLKRYLEIEDHLQPLTPFFLLHKGLLKGLKKASPLQEDLSVWDYFQKRFSQDFADTFTTPLIQGIFGGSSHELSARCCFPKLFEWEEKHGSLLKGWLYSNFHKKSKVKASLCSFKKGMKQLIDSLYKNINATIHLSTEIKAIEGKKVETSIGMFEADAIIYAMPTHATPFFLKNLEPLPFLTLSTVHVGYEGSQLPYRGFGYLSRLEEKEGFLGMTWDSEIFPEQNHGEQTRLTLMFRGKTQENFESHLIKMGIVAKPASVVIRTAKNAIPQYPLGYQARLKTLQMPGIYFVGPCFSGPGVNDCIHRAEEISHKVLAEL